MTYPRREANTDEAGNLRRACSAIPRTSASARRRPCDERRGLDQGGGRCRAYLAGGGHRRGGADRPGDGRRQALERESRREVTGDRGRPPEGGTAEGREEGCEGSGTHREGCSMASEARPEGETAKGLRNDTGIDSPTLKLILDKLVSSGQVVGCEVAKNGGEIRRVQAGSTHDGMARRQSPTVYTVVHTGGWRYGGIPRIPPPSGDSTPASRRDRESCRPARSAGAASPP